MTLYSCSSVSWNSLEGARQGFLSAVAVDYPEIAPDPLVSNAFPTSFTSSGGPNLATQVLLTDGSLMPWHRASVVQPCLRYWDIEAVGDGRHLSFFQMAVVVSVGGSRADVLDRLLGILLSTGIDRRRLWATVYWGGEVHGEVFEVDREAKHIWRDLGIEAGHIVQVLGSEGFVANRHEAVGGYRTELYFDRTGLVGLSCSFCVPSRCRCGRFVELGTAVVYDREVDFNVVKSIRRISAPPVHAAGVGLERVLQVVMGEDEIGSVGVNGQLQRVLLRGMHVEPVVAATASRIVDHLRALSFLSSTDGLALTGRANKQRRPIINRYYRRLREALRDLTKDQPEVAQALVERVIACWRGSPEGQSVLPPSTVALCKEICRRAELPVEVV